MKYLFTKEQYHLSNKNLCFCPTRRYCSKKELKYDIKIFIRKIKLTEHFYDNNQNQQAEKIVTEPVIKCKSNWEPKKNHHTIETLDEAVENIVEIHLETKKELQRNSFSETVKAEINYFRKRQDIVATETKEELTL